MNESNFRKIIKEEVEMIFDQKLDYKLNEQEAKFANHVSVISEDLNSRLQAVTEFTEGIHENIEIMRSDISVIKSDISVIKVGLFDHEKRITKLETRAG